MSNIVKSSPMPPRKDKELQPHLEKRRIVGSLRERTVYLKSPTNSQNYNQDDAIIESRKSILFDKLLNDLAKRINDHVERELTVQQISIDQKIDEIDEHTRSNLLIQETLEARLKKLRKRLRQKEHSHSQPVTSCRSGIALYNDPLYHYTLNSSDDSDIDKSQFQISMKYTKSQDDYEKSFYTSLW